MVQPIVSGPESLSSAIARRLEQMILDGTLLPRQKIPSERQLSTRMGASRTIVREALKELRGRGLIETRHGQGSVVAGLVPVAPADDPLSGLCREHGRTLFDLLEVRELLEGQAAWLAASRGSERDFHRITHAFQALAQAPSDAMAAARLDHRFHQAICEASHNPVLVHTLQGLMQQMLNTVLASVTHLYHRAPCKEEIDRHHRRIYLAVTGRRAERARNAATAHIRHIRERLLEVQWQERQPEYTGHGGRLSSEAK
ncbi:FCD domain-containing protein [Oceanimonas doudoroffii]|nr:FCD domain-containing protein [Oceanimonas doudoroffii]